MTKEVHKADTPARLRDIRRIVFLGDSITQGGDYVTDVECWLLAQGHSIEVIDVGLSSETATDLTPEENAGHLETHGFGRPAVSERLERTLAAVQPELLIVCYGMNDGEELPNDDSGLKRFAAAVTRLRDAALMAGATHVVLCTPPIHDNKGSNAPDPHEANLVQYRDWLVSKRADGWEIVDIHGPMRRELDENRKKDASFTFQPDGVHPDRAGHWVMAREILTQLFGADLGGVNGVEQLFDKNGDAIRQLVHERREVLLSAYLTQIGHTRPGAPGGPGQPPGPSIADAHAQALTIGEQIATKLA